MRLTSTVCGSSASSRTTQRFRRPRSGRHNGGGCRKSARCELRRSGYAVDGVDRRRGGLTHVADRSDPRRAGATCRSGRRRRRVSQPPGSTGPRRFAASANERFRTHPKTDLTIATATKRNLATRGVLAGSQQADDVERGRPGLLRSVRNGMQRLGRRNKRPPDLEAAQDVRKTRNRSLSAIPGFQLLIDGIPRACGGAGCLREGVARRPGMASGMGTGDAGPASASK